MYVCMYTRFKFLLQHNNYKYIILIHIGHFPAVFKLITKCVYIHTYLCLYVMTHVDTVHDII